MKMRLFIALVLCGLSLALWAFWIEPSRTVYREETLKISSLPKELSGIKIVFMADLHIGSPHVGLARLREIVAKVNDLEADVILLGGDYVVDVKTDIKLLGGNYVVDSVLGGEIIAPEKIFAELDKLDAPMGVFAVMGNHDWWHGYPDIVAKFKKHSPSIALLEDEAATLQFNGKDFLLLGITDYYEGPHAIDGRIREDDTDFTIALTHTPDIFPELPEKIALTFAGHTHGGQVYLPLLGRLVVPSKYGDKYAIGLITEGVKNLFVTAGIGTSIIGVRFLTPPEVNILILEP